MDQHENHSELVSGFFEEQKQIFDESSQGMYVFLDDDNRVCNEKFAQMLGYGSGEEWAKVDVKGAFPNAFVDSKSQQALVSAYQDAMEKAVGSKVKITWKKKTGETIDTEVILVPIVYKEHLFALHFISSV